MSETLIYSKPGLVDVIWRPDLKAVHLVWHSEYDEGTAVKDAVKAALAYVNEYGIKNWLADISHSRLALSAVDLDWVSGEEFRTAIRNSTLKRFVMIPPLPETGQDTSWLDDWAENTLTSFGKGTTAKILSEMTDIRAVFETLENGE